MSKFITASLTSLAIGLVPVAYAQDEAPVPDAAREAVGTVEEVVAEENVWKGSAGAGLTLSSGNATSQNINAIIDMKNISGRWQHAVSIAAINSSGEISEDTDGNPATPNVAREVRTAEQYYGGWKTDYELTNPKWYAFGAASYDDNYFSGYDFQATASVGAGYRMITSDEMNLSFEAGPGYRYNAFNDVDRITGVAILEDDGGEAIVRLGEFFDWRLTETTQLFQDLTVEAGGDTTVIRFNIGVDTKLMDALGLRVSFGLTNNTDAPPPTEKTDTNTSVTLTYSF